VRVGLVATYARWKGHELFLEAAARARRLAPEAGLRFAITGGPIYRTRGSQYSVEELRALAGHLGLEVDWAPFTEDAPAAYRALDVVVHASTRPEPFGRTIVEAMACGRAVVASGEGGPLEIVTPEVDGLIFTPRDPDALARAIARLALEPPLRERLGAAARETAVARFGRARLGPALLALYRRVLERPA
jgi:glycosyltransferase involved in cell wall biosynthesis